MGTSRVLTVSRFLNGGRDTLTRCFSVYSELCNRMEITWTRLGLLNRLQFDQVWFRKYTETYTYRHTCVQEGIQGVTQR